MGSIQHSLARAISYRSTYPTQALPTEARTEALPTEAHTQAPTQALPAEAPQIEIYTEGRVGQYGKFSVSSSDDSCTFSHGRPCRTPRGKPCGRAGTGRGGESHADNS